MKVHLSVGSMTCQMVSTKAIPCPLCRVVVPANTAHRCGVTTKPLPPTQTVKALPAKRKKR